MQKFRINDKVNVIGKTEEYTVVFYIPNMYNNFQYIIKPENREFKDSLVYEDYELCESKQSKLKKEFNSDLKDLINGD